MYGTKNNPPLPIEAVLPELASALVTGTKAVLTAPPGSGKTTIVPLALLDAPWFGGKRIIMLEPRRLATRMAAARMADLLSEEVGATVGYRIRFERRLSKATRIEVVTEGILTRMLQNDPELAGVGMVIFDEFHERSIHADLALALTLEVMAELRPDLRLLIMSATLDTAAIATLLDNAPVITGGGQLHPVTIRYREAAKGSVPHQTAPPAAVIAGEVAAGVRQTLATVGQGDVLAFLPGEAEIRACHGLLAHDLREDGIALYPLYGSLTRQEQDRAVFPAADGGRRVILATSIAETSLTIEGVSIVVDSGWTRVPRFDPNTGLSRLVTVRVPRAGATQRAGRAGRLGPGVCLRLWPQSLDVTLRERELPEILSADLAPLVLELALWGVTEPGSLQWLDSPPAGAIAQARELLAALGAIDWMEEVSRASGMARERPTGQGRITALGREMAGLPVHPRLAGMLVLAREKDGLALACDLAALLSERDVLPRGRTAGEIGVDMEYRCQALETFRRKGGGRGGFGADEEALRRVAATSTEFWRLLGGKGRQGKGKSTIGILLAHAYPDRIAGCRRPGDRGRFVLVSGRGATLDAGDGLAGVDFLVAPEIDARGSEGRIFRAAAISLEAIRASQAGRLGSRDQVFWDDQRQLVTAVREERLGELILASGPLPDPDPRQVREVLLGAIAAAGLEKLPWSTSARQLQARIESLRRWRPDLDLPETGDEFLSAHPEDWLAPALTGMTRFDDLKKIDLDSLLQNRLSWTSRRLLDEGAPTHLTVPSGSRLRLDYAGDASQPVLRVRLQEMFGLGETPTVCWGRVAVVVHLLSPAQRPIQITADLGGFWKNTYHLVKKEMQGRYPRHHWPDDPWNTPPTTRTKNKSE